MENNAWAVQIDKLMVWKVHNWVKCENKSNKLMLRVVYDQMLITSNLKILESLNMRGKMKGVYKEDILILIINSGQEIRKIKFQIKVNVTQCLKNLGEIFPVINHNHGSSKDCFQSKYRDIDEVLKIALTQKDQIIMPPDFSNFVKLCLLDPNFPKIVVETENIIKSLSSTK